MVLIKYATVGCVGTALDLSFIYVFVEFMRIHLLIAAVMSFLLAAINNFIMNKYWTFQNTGFTIRKQFIQFLTVSSIGLVLTLISMAFFVYGLRIWYMSAKVITSVLVLTWNFLAKEHWMYEDRIIDASRGEPYDYDFSVIVPAYNEKNRIRKTLVAIDNYFRHKPLTRQIIVVDDGSIDDTTVVVEGLRKEINDLSVIRCHPNRGKGHAIKIGVELSLGKYILFMDADNSTPIEELERFYPLLKKNQVVIGSRYLPDSKIVVRQPRLRVIIGRLANMLIQCFILDGVKDTQCGFKAFHHDAAKAIFRRMKVDRFGFDIEALAIARLFNFSVKETPVSWYNSPESRVRPVKDAFRTFKDLIYIKLNLWSGQYN